MNRSPILIFIILLCLISCSHSKEKTEKKVIKSKKQDTKAIHFQEKADILYLKAKYDSAFYFYNKSKILFDATASKTNSAYCLIQMARSQQVSGDYFGSEVNLIEALPYIKNNKPYLSAANNLLGIVAKELQNFNQAIQYYTQTLELAEDAHTRAVALNNIANVYLIKGEYTKAINLWNAVLKGKFLDTLPKRKALYLDNLGFAYFKKGNKTKALSLMTTALTIRDQEQDSYGSIESNLHLSEYYLDHNKTKATKHALKAYQAATTNKSVDERLKALLLLIKTANAKKYALQYATVNDSITNVRNQSKNQFAKIRYDARVANEENLRLKNEKIATDLQLQKSQNEKNVWVSASALLATLIFLIYNYLKSKNRLEKQKATYFTETKIAKKIHDEIANDVFQTMSFVETKKIEEPENRETLINLLDNLYQRSRNISKENESIETGPFFFETIIQMINGYKSANQNIIIKKDDSINWESLAEIKKITLFRVLQELLVNMKKHSQASIVVVNFSNQNKNIKIEYADNGKGLEIKSIKKSGLANVENRIKNINGTITFDTTSNGLKVKVNIPK